MKAKPQGKLEGSLLGKILKNRFFVILSNWVFQGMRYMNFYEISLKLILDVMISVLLMYTVFYDLAFVPALLISIIIAHTVNWIINGHIFVLMRYVAPVAKTEQQFDDFIRQMKSSTTKWQSIDGIAIYGSYCRGSLHKYSDLDVRVLTKPGFINAIKGALYCFYQRLIAIFHLFPLDVYFCDKMEFLDQLRDDEIPVILIDHSGRLSQRYPKSKHFEND